MRVRHGSFLASAVLLALCGIFCGDTFQATPALAGSAPRDTIDAGDCYFTSSTACFLRADPTGGASAQAAANKGTISPSGRGPSEDIHVLVTVRNILGSSLPGATVVATAMPMGGATFRWDDGSLPGGDTGENPQTGLSDGQGQVELIYDEGGIAHPPSPAMPALDFVVTTQGPGPGPPVAIPGCPTRFSLLSFDLNADGRVDLTDFAVFSADFGAGNPRSDFNWSGTLNLTDFVMFAAHFRASLDTQ